MREIKFKIWDKKQRKIIGWEKLKYNIQGLFNSFLGEGNFTPMQYTGLKDKNGVEIYEGDIVKCHVDFFAMGVVKYIDTAYVLDGMHYQLRVGQIHYSLLEVIGNIYENPDLIPNQEAK